ncbi:LysR family transcriptional regulator [Pseudomonas sp. UL073]|uniref:LysR family transcriptional regulator n=1 Tax=Zestomonas insulae TaxID=2809017 RepID=A0ABS2IIZ3_9GAMM|nr:LysR family transcriptional regulator [Pseudomonas insulae]MBM7061818.1 LysR family transcriptional regulator [Pseudomonas insulae]
MLDLRDIDLNVLLAFDAIYTQCSITRAAEVMGLSQPAMSNALRRLRTLCNDPLFIKTQQGVTPTVTAHRLSEHVRQALSSLREGLGQLSQEQLDGATPLRVSCLDCLQPLLLAALQPDDDAWQVRFYQPRRRDAYSELLSGKLDVLIDIDQPLSQLDGLRKLALFDDHYVFAYGHGLSAAPTTLEDYLSTPQLQVSSRRDGLSPVDLELGLRGRKRNIAATVQSSLAARLIADQRAVGMTLPSRIAEVLGLKQAALPLPQPIALSFCVYVDGRYRRMRGREQQVARIVELLAPSTSSELLRRA